MVHVQPRVLFIDDGQDILTLCEAVLTDAKFNIKTASTGEAGIEAAGSFHPHVIFLDMVLQDMNSIDVADKILAQHDNPKHKPIVYAFTSFRPEDIRNEMNQAGILSCVHKAFDLDVLKKNLIDAVLEAMTLLSAERDGAEDSLHNF